MLFMLSILGFRLFHRRHSIDGSPNIKIPVSNQNAAALSQTFSPPSSMTCSHRNRSAVQSAHLTILKRLELAYSLAHWLQALKLWTSHNYYADAWYE